MRRAPRRAPLSHARLRPRWATSSRTPSRRPWTARASGRGVVELLLGAEQRVEHLVAQALAHGEGHAGADDADQQQLGEAAAALLLLLGALAQRLTGVAERLGGVLDFLLQLLVVEDLRRRSCRWSAGRTRSCAVSNAVHDVLAQFLVLDEALDVRAGPRRGTARLGRLLLGCHSSSPDVACCPVPILYPALCGCTRALAAVGRGRVLERHRRTSPISSTNTNSRSSRRCSGMSSMSRSLQRGRDDARARPLRWAASAFSFSPPIGSTWPVSVISPVIATSSRTGPRR